MSRKNNPKIILAAGGLVLRPAGNAGEILLIHRNGVWDLPKGKIEKNESREEAAIREVEEETGIQIKQISRFLCESYHEYREDGVLYGKITYWYEMVPADPSQTPEPQLEEGIEAIKWASPQKALQLVAYDNLKGVISSSLG